MDLIFRILVLIHSVVIVAMIIGVLIALRKNEVQEWLSNLGIFALFLCLFSLLVLMISSIFK